MKWKREYILWGILWCLGAMYIILFREGYRFLPGAKWLSEVIPLWLVILNLVVLFIFTTLLVNKTNPSPIIAIAILIGILLSGIVLGSSFKRFPYVSGIGGLAVILFGFGLKRWGSKKSRVAT
ncbi:MAG TPA: hypothetical protein VNL73_02745 [Verrucomicrobiae bacterium]|nr:hypothetical protein [Verrucomicrobiae bacterium]